MRPRPTCASGRGARSRSGAPREVKVVVTLVAVLGALVAAWAPPLAPAAARPRSAPSLVCGELPTTDVVLRSDLTCDTPFHFVGDQPRVAIDLGGHTLTVAGDAGRCTRPGPCGAIAGAREVRNGTVVGTLHDIGAVRCVLVVGDIEVATRFTGATGPATVHRTMVLDGMVRIWGSDVAVTRSVIRGSVVVNSTDRAVRDLVVERNMIVLSPGAGVSIAPLVGSFPEDVTGRVTGNLIWGAAGHGISVGGGIWNVGYLDVSANLLIGNGGDGFRSGTDASGPPAAVGGPVTVSGNLAVHNGGHGFDAQWMTGVDGTGIIDGGRNRAAANGTDPPCAGVAC